MPKICKSPEFHVVNPICARLMDIYHLLCIMGNGLVFDVTAVPKGQRRFRKTKFPTGSDSNEDQIYAMGTKNTIQSRTVTEAAGGGSTSPAGGQVPVSGLDKQDAVALQARIDELAVTDSPAR